MTSLAPRKKPARVIKAVKGGRVMAVPSLQRKTAPPLQAPEERNAGPFPSRALRLDPKTPREVATWTSPRGTAAICKTHVWLGTFRFKLAGDPPSHQRGLEGLVLPAPRGHHGVLESLIFPVPRGTILGI